MKYFIIILTYPQILWFQVLWVQQQHEKKRSKRDFVDDRGFSSFAGSDLSSLYEPQELSPAHHPHYRGAGPAPLVFPDPLFKEQWYLVSVKNSTVIWYENFLFSLFFLFVVKYESTALSFLSPRFTFSVVRFCKNNPLKLIFLFFYLAISLLWDVALKLLDVIGLPNPSLSIVRWKNKYGLLWDIS